VAKQRLRGSDDDVVRKDDAVRILPEKKIFNPSMKALIARLE